MKRAAMLLMIVTGSIWAQDKPVEETGYYKLDFVVKEVEGAKTLNSRAYTMMISTSRNSQVSSVKVGSRIPMTGKDGAPTYMELGINFDCRSAKAVGGELAVYVSADLSSVAEGSANPPVIRNNRWAGDVIVPLRKPTIVFTSDDATSKKQMQLELTATPATPGK